MKKSNSTSMPVTNRYKLSSNQKLSMEQAAALRLLTKSFGYEIEGVKSMHVQVFITTEKEDSYE